MPLDITPPYPPPAEDKIESAGRDLPDVLADMPRADRFANAKPTGQHRLVLAADLVDALAQAKGHPKAAAAHALHRLAQLGLLVPEVAVRPGSSITSGGRFPETEQALAAIDGRPFDPAATEPTTTTFPERPLHSGEGPVPFNCLLVRSTDALWDANRGGTVATRPRFRPDKPRPGRAEIDDAKRLIQQEIFNRSNADGEVPPERPHRVVNGAVLLVNCGRRTTHSAFQWAVCELAQEGLLGVRPASRPQFLSVYGDGFGVGGRADGGERGGRPVLGEDQTPLGLFVLETTNRLFAGQLGTAAPATPTAPGGRQPRAEVPLDDFHRQSVAAHEHGLMVYDAIRVFPGERVNVTGYSCKVVAGDRPTLCPDARPPLPPSMLPVALRAVRRLNQLPPGTTIHWVGHDTGIRNRCRCHPDAPFAAPFDRERWEAVASSNRPPAAPANPPAVTPPPAVPDPPLADPLPSAVRPASPGDYVALADALRHLRDSLHPLPADGERVSVAWDTVLRRLGGTDRPTAAQSVLGLPEIPEGLKVALIEFLDGYADIYNRRRLGQSPEDFVAVGRFRSLLARLIDLAPLAGVRPATAAPTSGATDPARPIPPTPTPTRPRLPRAQAEAVEAERLAHALGGRDGSQSSGSTNEEVYNWLIAHRDDERVRPLLPASLDAFKKALGRARANLRIRKRRPPAAPTGKSVVSQHEVEPPSWDDD